MKSILQSIKPQYCELIASGKKTIEVRKTKPKLDVPFKVYIYCTKPKSKNDLGLCHEDGKVGLVYQCNYDVAELYDMQILSGKIIGEYVCDKIINLFALSKFWLSDEILSATCLTPDEIRKYANGADKLYGWHISDLKIYDKPKELSEFGKECNLDCPSVHCPYWKYQRVNADEWDYDCSCNNIRPLTRPPQSWCCVEEVCI